MIQTKVSPSPAGDCDAGAGRRELLRDTVRYLGGWFAGKVPVRPPVFIRIDDSCDACGACARVCQTGAITVEREAMADGLVQAHVLYDPSACALCHSCEAVCWPKAIRFEAEDDPSLSWPFARGKLVMRTVRGRDCKTCGALVAEGKECRLCSRAARPAGA